MRRILTLIILVMALGIGALGQQGNTVTIQTHGTPTGSCSGIMRAVDIDNNLLYFCSAATWLAATAGGVTPSGTLTLNHVALGGGTSVVKVDSSLVTDGAGALSGATSISTGTAPTACGSATACFAGTEASTAGTPTAGQSYFRFDSTAHALKGSYNNGAEFTMLPAPSTSGNVMTSDGTNWTSTAPTGGGSFLDWQKGKTAITGTGSAVDVYSTSVPSIPAGKCVKATFWFGPTTATSGPSKVINVVYGTATPFTVFSQTANSTNEVVIPITICNDPGVQNAQTLLTGLRDQSGAIAFPLNTTLAQDSSGALTLKVTWTAANTEAITPRGWLVEKVQ